MDVLVASSKQFAVSGMEHFLKVFSFVPEEKLTWKPAPTAKSPMRIAAHTALYAGRFARMLRDRELPGGDDIAEWIKRRDAEEDALTSRAEMEKLFRQGTEEAVAALDSLTPEEVEGTVNSRFGHSMPMTFLMNLPGLHAYAHTAQIDLLQTCWDDQEVHF